LTNVNNRIDPAVYGLHAGDEVYFYVGFTTKNSDNRRYEHIYRARSGHAAAVYDRIREIGLANLCVTDLVKISDVSSGKRVEAEKIKELIDLGFPIRNTLGRDGVPDSLPEEMRSTMASTRRGKATWIKGKTGEDAGWTDSRRLAMSESARIRAENREPKHGTKNEYSLHSCRCDLCFSAARNPKAKAQTHGRYLYKRDRCRCEVCVKANRDYLNKWYAEKARLQRESSNYRKGYAEPPVLIQAGGFVMPWANTLGS